MKPAPPVTKILTRQTLPAHPQESRPVVPPNTRYPLIRSEPSAHEGRFRLAHGERHRPAGAEVQPERPPHVDTAFWRCVIGRCSCHSSFTMSTPTGASPQTARELLTDVDDAARPVPRVHLSKA